MSDNPTALDGTHNFRDLGGLPITGGGTTRSGVFYRADALHGLTSTGLKQLEDSDIDVIVDFRTPQESQAAPDGLPAGRSIRLIELPLLEGDMSRLAGNAVAGVSGAAQPDLAAIEQLLAKLPSLADLYLQMLTGGASSFAQVARLIAQLPQPGGLLIHCTAGKDRTGVCAALVLDVVGVERSAIIEDYTRTEANLAGPWLEGMTDMIAHLGLPLTPQMEELMGGSPAAAIEAALAWIDQNGRSVAYLRSGGLTDAELSALRERLTG